MIDHKDLSEYPSKETVERMLSHIRATLPTKHRMRKSTAVTVGAAIVLVFGVGGTAVAAASSGSLTKLFGGSDAAEYANNKGMNAADAEAALKNQAEHASDLGHARRLAGDRLIGASFADKPTIHIEVRVTSGPAIEQLDAFASASSFPIEVHYVSSSSHATLQSIIDSRLADWQEAFPEIQGAYVNELSGRIEIDVEENQHSTNLLASLRDLGLGDEPAHINLSAPVGDH